MGMIVSGLDNITKSEMPQLCVDGSEPSTSDDSSSFQATCQV